MLVWGGNVVRRVSCRLYTEEEARTVMFCGVSSVKQRGEGRH